MKLQTLLFALKTPVDPPFSLCLHQTERIGAITPAYLKPPKCVEQVAHNALLLLFGSRSQDGRFHNAFKWHITGRSLAGLPRTISPGAKEEQQAQARTFSTKRTRRGGCLQTQRTVWDSKSPFNCRVCSLNFNALFSNGEKV